MSRLAVAVALVLGLAALVPAGASAHGGDEPILGAPASEGRAPEAEDRAEEAPAAKDHAAEGHGGETSAEEAEVAALAAQPARVLAQQALATLQVNGDEHEAALRLDAALESEDTGDVDLALLRKAAKTLDEGDPEGAVPLLDEALSRPFGAASGEALHAAGREFRPAASAQDVVGIVVGAVLLLLGLLALRPRRLGQRTSEG
ncbi:MAG: hypothetical protein FVQ78_01725 [Solirubrobacterales bacterium]|nr:hypothetical protein [Solirubrobacterales bacterium]